MVQTLHLAASRRLGIGLAAIGALLLANCSAPPSQTPVSSDLPSSPASPASGSASPAVALTIGFGFEDLTNPQTDWNLIAERLDEVGADGITLGVGRPEWVGFAWPGHEGVWASRVSEEIDLVAEVLETIGTDASGRQRTVTLVVDVLAPALIAEHPDLAGVDHDRHTSEAFPSATAFVGDWGQQVADLCGAVAERYRPDRIALTELILEHTYSESDHELFAEMTGTDPDADWPSHAGAERGAWRSQIVAGVVADCAAQAHPHGVEVDTDVRANWDDPGADRLESGHDYVELLDAGDRLTVWNYFPLNDREPGYSAEITAGLADRFSADELARITVSVGLWADGDDDAAGDSSAVLAAEAMKQALIASATNGITEVSLTPHSMMTQAHWDALAELGW